MKAKLIQIISVFLLFLMAISPIAFASELKTVKVSELKPGQVIVDKEGNEIIVENISTQEKEFSTISEIINQLVSRNPNSPYSTGNVVTYIGDGQNGAGIVLTGNAVFGEITGRVTKEDQVSTGVGKSTYYNDEGRLVTYYLINPGFERPATTEEANIFDAQTRIPDVVAPEKQTLNTLVGLPKTSATPAPVGEDSPAPEIGTSISGGSNVRSNQAANSFEYTEMEALYIKNSKGEEINGAIIRQGDTVEFIKNVAEDEVKYNVKITDYNGESQTFSVDKSAFETLQANKGLQYSAIEQYNLPKGSKPQEDGTWLAPSGAVYSATGSFVGRGQIQTTFGNMGFGMGQLVQGVQWAATVVGFVQLFAPILGMDAQESNAISVALGAGIMAGKLSYSLLGRGGINGFLGENSKLGGKTLFSYGGQGQTGRFLSSPGFSAGVGVATAWLIYNSMWGKETTKIETVNFQCMPWQAPHGGLDCELCNDDTLPCSEYKCKSLGQSCDIINKGTSAERCVNMNPRDVSPPIIKPLDSALSFNLVYSDVKENPPGAGFKIKSKDTTTGCIKPFSSIEFGVETNEPAQCKIDYVEGKNYSQMATYFSGSNLYEYNHTEALSLPSAESFKNSSLVLENGKELHLFMKCRDSQGNTNEADYELSLCVDPSPDTTAPQISATSISSGSCVAATSQNSSMTFYVNEPSECRWSPQDQSFDSMKNNMTCANSITEINALQLYSCNTLLTGIAQGGSDFYVRCKDQPNGVNESKRNVNQESYKFNLKGSNPLRMGAIRPNATIYGSVNPMPVELSTSTLFGCDNGQAICYYSTTGSDNSFIKFFDTDKEDGIHTQRLDLSSGTYTYTVKCVDSGGNLAQNSTTFRVDVDPNAPMIARVYEEDNYLKIVTPQNSECFFSNENCDFLNEGTPMPYQNSTTHVTPWISDKTYYIKCMDQFRSLPTDCSLVVKPTENFL